MPRRTVSTVLALVMVAQLCWWASAASATAGPARGGRLLHLDPRSRRAPPGRTSRSSQIRVSGYPASGEVIAIDGEYGPATEAAVTRFQQAYGLAPTASRAPPRSRRSTRCRTTTARRSTSPSAS